NIPLIKIIDKTGRNIYFRETSSNQWDGVFGEKGFVLTENSEFTWHRSNGTRYHFSSLGQLMWVKDQVGNHQQLTYYTTNNHIHTITDIASGRVLTFYYNDNNNGDFLEYIIGPITTAVSDGKWVSYGYDANNNLTSVTYADGSGFVYGYAPPNTDENKTTDDLNNLSTKKDMMGHVLATWKYDSNDRVIESTTQDGKGVKIDYSNYDAGGSTIDVTDAYGVKRAYTILSYNNIPKVKSIVVTEGCANCDGNQPIRYEYDDENNIIEEAYANGKTIKYTQHDDRGNPTTIIHSYFDENSNLIERTIYYEYHETLNTPLRRFEASVVKPGGNKETIWDYDIDGDSNYNENPSLLLQRKIEKGFTKNLYDQTSVPFEYITNYDYYYPNGQLKSIDGPKDNNIVNDVQTFEYDSNGNLKKNIQWKTSTHSLITSFDEFDSAGNPSYMIDINDQRTDFTYDGKNKLLTTTINSVVNSSTFNTAGNIQSVTKPGGRTLTYGYYNSGRLKTITDALGNYLNYGYDTQGNVIEDYVFDSNDEKKRWYRFDYQNPTNPGKLWRMLYPNGGATLFTYDEVGNINSETDPLNRITSYQYGPLDRLDKIIQPGPAEPTIKYFYDAHGNVNKIVDPSSTTENPKETHYEYDDMGRLLKIESPESGTTKFLYNEILSWMKQLDANGIIKTYNFDSLGRVKNISYSNSTEQVVFTYDDTDTYGKGKLRSMSVDSEGSNYYSYNALGQLTVETRYNNGGPQLDTWYGYNPTNTDHEIILYPNSGSIHYQRNNNGQISAILDGSQNIIINNITYMPFGPVEDYEIPLSGTDTLKVDRTFNARYLVDSIKAVTGTDTDTVMDYQYKYYADGSVQKVDGVSVPTALEEARMDYAIFPDANKINSISKDSVQVALYVYDGGNDTNGNITSDGTHIFEYNKKNQLIKVTRDNDGTILAEFAYDGKGRRVKKVDSVQSKTTYFIYDKDNNLIGERDSSGNRLRDYIYLGTEPIAMKVYGDQAGIYYFLNDHLGTPQKIVDSAGTVVWEAAFLPFGLAQIHVETITNNIRFPGQYYDAETGLHYNWHRYYDPATGRYLTPDPIGLAGGINLYSYTNGNPVNYIDPDGLAPDWVGYTGPILTGVGGLIVVYPHPYPKIAGWALGGIGSALILWDAATSPNEHIDFVEQKMAPVNEALEESQRAFEKLDNCNQ
ncbi:RHS domain-containing protein, partial [Candidatus Pacearchaeota archaeon]|nr:RHS domain-containing protein [Candidatus Pacearchaeota archaeon]